MGQVRLVGGVSADSASGRVEVCVGEVWGSVCDLGDWDTHNTAVVCHQLGLPSTRTYTYTYIAL